MAGATFELEQQLFIGRIDDLLVHLQPFVEPDFAKLTQPYPEFRRKSLLAGRALLKFALVRNGLLSLHEPLPDIAYNASKKPYFTELPVHFNLSHSHGWMALSLGSQPQGIDIEAIDFKRRLKPHFLEYVLDLPELEYFKNLSPLDPVSYAGREFFFLQWTLKECLLKLQGSSIFALKELKFDPKLRCVQVPLSSNFHAVSEQLVPWCNYTLSFKLSELIQQPIEQDLWLTVGAYTDHSPQIWGLLPQTVPNLASLEDLDSSGSLDRLDCPAGSVGSDAIICKTLDGRISDKASCDLLSVPTITPAPLDALAESGAESRSEQVAASLHQSKHPLNWFLMRNDAALKYELTTVDFALR